MYIQAFLKRNGLADKFLGNLDYYRQQFTSNNLNFADSTLFNYKMNSKKLKKCGSVDNLSQSFNERKKKLLMHEKFNKEKTFKNLHYQIIIVGAELS